MGAGREHPSDRDADRASADMPAALIELVRLLARQAAREAFATDCNTKEPAKESLQ